MKIKITVKRIACYKDLMNKYENPIKHACNMNLEDEFISDGFNKPDGFCDEAWKIIEPWVNDLANGKEDFFDGWMKNKKSAMISCNDGFRPVSFYIEVID